MMAGIIEAGAAKSPILERLQVKHGRQLCIVGAPADVDEAIGALDRRASADRAGVVLVFVHDLGAWTSRLMDTLAGLHPNAILWVAYPKLTSPLAGDLSRDIIHGLAAGAGLDPVTQVAIDTNWSALRLKRL